ncbi:MAG: hypothetical protein ACI9CF_000692 [Candidatus Omnitrophota bacterium]|jgi:hypothetical protein
MGRHLFLAVIAVCILAVGLSSCGKSNDRDRSSSLTDADLQLLASSSGDPGNPQAMVEIIPAPIPPMAINNGITAAVPVVNANLVSKATQGTTNMLPMKTNYSFEQKVQAALAKLNLYSGPIDGKVGKGTRAAIMKFQTKSGLTPDGMAGPATWMKLKKSYYSDEI